MATELDDDLREDFLNESQELLGRLSEQLVDLERTPDDRELLNAIFRGFHTIKGSAGFFELRAVVELAHVAEEVFGLLRSGAKQLDAAMMDAVLDALDELRTMLNAVADNKKPRAAKKKLIETLKSLAVADEPPAAPEAAEAEEEGREPEGPAADPFSDDEFEALLDQLQGKSPAPAPADPVAAAPAAAEPAPPQPAPAHPAAAADAGKESAETTVRVETQRLDQVMNLVGELVLVRNRIKNLGKHKLDPDALRKAFSELDLITSGLQNNVMRMRMQPIRKLFSRFPRLARDTARKLGKQVEVELVGDDTELDKTLVEALNDPLMHMVRNAVDHGLEMPAVRSAAGKPAGGRIRLSAEQVGDQIHIVVSDDGGGIDPGKLKRKAVEKGLIDAAAAAAMSADEALQLVFLPGFSTKEQVSDLSGRGVGMDVVRSNIVALNGAVHIESVPGQGSAVQIRVPLTLAIQPVLMVERAGRLFAVPLQAVQDVFSLDPAAPRERERWETLAYRDSSLRLLRLSRWAGGADDSGRPHVVVVRVGVERYGLVVGQVRGREEIVVKPLGRMLRGLAGVAGGTVTGEGRVALILELPSLVSAYERSLNERAQLGTH